MRLDDDRRLPDRIAAEARFRQIDLSIYIPLKEAEKILCATNMTVRYHFDWLEGVTLCGRKFVKRDRAEWLGRWRRGELTGDDRTGVTLATYDLKAARQEIERKKQEEEETKRQEA